MHCSRPQSDRFISSFKDCNITDKAIQSNIDLDQNCSEKLRTKNSLKNNSFSPNQIVSKKPQTFQIPMMTFNRPGKFPSLGKETIITAILMLWKRWK